MNESQFRYIQHLHRQNIQSFKQICSEIEKNILSSLCLNKSITEQQASRLNKKPSCAVE